MLEMAKAVALRLILKEKKKNELLKHKNLPEA